MENNMTALEKIAGIFLEPVRVMKSIKLRPDLLIPFFIFLLIAIVNVPLQEELDVLLGATTHPLMAEVEGAGWTFLLTISSFLGTMLSWFFLGAVYLLLARLLGGTTNYRQMLSVTGYASLVNLVYNLLSLIGLRLGGFLLTLNPSVLLPLEERLNTTLGLLLSRFDILGIYYLVLIGLGLIYVAGLGKYRALAIMLFFWMAGTIFHLLLSLIM